MHNSSSFEEWFLEQGKMCRLFEITATWHQQRAAPVVLGCFINARKGSLVGEESRRVDPPLEVVLFSLLIGQPILISTLDQST